MDNCKICNSNTTQIFTKNILGKYNTAYLQCDACRFIQTTEPFWLSEAYGSAITSLDIGLLNRNIWLSEQVANIIDACFPESKVYLDYAGGYGTLTRMMRDKGFDFYRQDQYCENIFANYFDLVDSKNTRFDVVTAFEVFEHFENPIAEIQKTLEFSDNLIFSTSIIPQNNAEIENWWYIAEETGQHIAFYSLNSLKLLAEKFGKHFYSNNHNLHIFSKNELCEKQIIYAFQGKTEQRSAFGLLKRSIDFQKNRSSLLESDFKLIKKKLNAQP